MFLLLFHLELIRGSSTPPFTPVCCPISPFTLHCLGLGSPVISGLLNQKDSSVASFCLTSQQHLPESTITNKQTKTTSLSWRLLWLLWDSRVSYFSLHLISLLGSFIESSSSSPSLHFGISQGLVLSHLFCLFCTSFLYSWYWFLSDISNVVPCLNFNFMHSQPHLTLLFG